MASIAGRGRNRSVFRNRCGRVTLEVELLVEWFLIGLDFAEISNFLPSIFPEFHFQRFLSKIHSHKIFTSFSTSLNSSSPVTNSTRRCFANAAAKQSAKDIFLFDLKMAACLAKSKSAGTM